MTDGVVTHVSLRDLRTQLSVWMACAQSGEVVDVTSHRKSTARMTPIRAAASGATSPLQVAIDACALRWNVRSPFYRHL